MNLTSNRDLFDLVKSLSKSEKRFLKLNAMALNLPTNQLTFFNKLELESEFKQEFFTAKNPLKDDVNKHVVDNLYAFNLKY